MSSDSSKLPVVDVTPLLTGEGDKFHVAAQIEHACKDSGFFYIIGHGVDQQLQQRLEDMSRLFFAQCLDSKMTIRMELGGRAWRGYFPVGGELTSGRPDRKEGIYFGAELTAEHSLVRSATPMHGANLFPDIDGFRETILDYLTVMTGLGHALMKGIALSLGLNEEYFAERYTADPLILFRIFNYPPDPGNQHKDQGWGVGEHTDYGLLTILKQDRTAGLEVKSRSGWIEATPIPNSFVCNIGDMLDRMTGGLYRSTPHRVKSHAGQERLSFPFFFDPNFNSEIRPIELMAVFQDDCDQRWDQASVHEFSGTYGDYLLSKVSKVFPQLRRAVL